MLPGIRYDRIAESWDATASTSRIPDRIVPALERAFAAGRPALVNMVSDKRIGHPTLGGNLLGSTASA